MSVTKGEEYSRLLSEWHLNHPVKFIFQEDASVIGEPDSITQNFAKYLYEKRGISHFLACTFSYGERDSLHREILKLNNGSFMVYTQESNVPIHPKYEPVFGMITKTLVFRFLGIYRDLWSALKDYGTP